MTITRIICPVDFSPCGEAALHYASHLARASGATLAIVHVKPAEAEFEFSMGGGNGEVDVHARFNDVRPPDPELAFSQRMLTGDPAEAIVQFANEQSADLIVMGTHGRRGLSRLLMGSTAESVIRNANCAVLTIRSAGTPLSCVEG